jgi:hypothetical protein
MSKLFIDYDMQTIHPRSPLIEGVYVVEFQDAVLFFIHEYLLYTL